MHNEEQIIERIASFAAGQATDEEKRWLDAWVKQSPENDSFFRKTLHIYHNASLAADEKSLDAARKRIWNNLRPVVSRRKTRRWVRTAAGYAAAVALLVGTGLFLLLDRSPVNDDMTNLVSHQAILRTADGEEFEIFFDREQVYASDGVQIDEFLSVLDKAESTDILHFEVLRGGTYKLRLEDGSTVLLNSESSIRFPQTFDRERREIEVTGEVYLDVATDTARPFIVKTGGVSIEVLGTRFVVCSYNDEQTTVVLEEGSVRIRHDGQILMLEPGFKAVMENGRLSKYEADLGRELAWTNGLFVFEHDPLYEVLNRLSYWYDVEFDFADRTLGDERFTGKMNREMRIEEILSLIERINVVKFEKQDHRYIVKNKRQKR